MKKRTSKKSKSKLTDREQLLNNDELQQNAQPTAGQSKRKKKNANQKSVSNIENVGNSAQVPGQVSTSDTVNSNNVFQASNTSTQQYHEAAMPSPSLAPSLPLSAAQRPSPSGARAEIGVLQKPLTSLPFKPTSVSPVQAIAPPSAALQTVPRATATPSSSSPSSVQEQLTVFTTPAKENHRPAAVPSTAERHRQSRTIDATDINDASHSSLVTSLLSIGAHHSRTNVVPQSAAPRERTPLLSSTDRHHHERAHCSTMTSTENGHEPDYINTGQSVKNYSAIGSQPLDRRSQRACDDIPQEMVPNENINFFIYVITVLSAIGGFLFGYDTGIVSGAMVFIRDHFKLDEIWQEVIVSATILSAWVFSILAGPITNRMGRKFVILLASGIFTLGGFMMAFAPDKYTLLSGRFIVGIAIGLASMVIPVYIAEVAPVSIRGRLVTINTCCITFGQFVASVVAGLLSKNVDSGWRWMLGLAAVPSIIQMVFFIFMPESPRWLIQKGKYEEALKSLSKCRSGTPQSLHVLSEFEVIKSSSLNNHDESKGSMDVLRSKPVRRALFIGCFLMMYQQLAGINTVMYYSATIIQMSGVTNKSTAVWLSAVTSFINFICSFIGMASVERFGRRILVLLSMLGVVLALSVLGVGFLLASIHSPNAKFEGDPTSKCSAITACSSCVHSPECGFCFEKVTTSTVHAYAWTGTPQVNGSCVSIDPYNVEYANSSSLVCQNGSDGNWIWATMWCPSNYSWLILLGLISYLFFFAPGMGCMPWTINSEIYPLWARSFCCAASTSTNWFFNLIVSMTFLSLANALTAQGAYFLYSGVAVSGFLIFYFFLPETKGRKLEEIESIFNHSLCEMRFAQPCDISSSNNNNNDSNGSVNNCDPKSTIVTPRHC